MDKNFQEYLIQELQYLRESMDIITRNYVTKDEYDSNKRTVTGWIIGIMTLFISVVFGLISFFK